MTFFFASFEAGIDTGSLSSGYPHRNPLFHCACSTSEQPIRVAARFRFRVDGRQPLPYRITEGLPVICPESMPSAEIASYKPTYQDSTGSQCGALLVM